MSVSSHNLTLSVSQGNELAVHDYNCSLEPEQGSSIHTMLSGETQTVTGMLPDTKYTIGCVGYDEQGQYLCVEANTTVITRE